MIKLYLLRRIAVLVILISNFLMGCETNDEDLIQEETEENTEEESENSTITQINEGVLDGVLDQNITLKSTIVYELTGPFVVEAGATLTIPSGTEIVANEGNDISTNVYIIVESGAKIVIQGTEDSPVNIGTKSGLPNGWGGISILGKGITTAGVELETSIRDIGYAYLYGGDNDDDDSGSISYLVISGAGGVIIPKDNSLRPAYKSVGLSLFAVGSGTTIDHVTTMNGAGDGIKFFGGSVSVSNLLSEQNQNSAIAWTQGWSGSIENARVLHDDVNGFPFLVISATGENGNPSINNLTSTTSVFDTDPALQFSDSSGATITEFSLTGYSIPTVDMIDDGSLNNVIINGEPSNPLETYNNDTGN